MTKLFNHALSVTLTLFSLTIPQVSYAQEYSFTVVNKTNTAIGQILVSEDGDTWNYFEIGDGISPGETVKLVWDKSTNNQSCEQYIKAVYSDGSEAEAASFDFCQQNDLVFE